MNARIALASALLIFAAAAQAERRGPISLDEAEAHAAERFTAFDADGDGRISADEFNAADVRPPRFMPRGHRRGPWSDGGGPKFDEIDADGDGAISREELDAARSAGHRQGKPDKAAMKERLFARLDADQDGFLSQAEFGEPVERLRALDANGDGQVDRGERRSGLRKRGHG